MGCMKLESLPDGFDGYCGTSYAARMLKLSVGTIQNLVETNVLKAWKTQGGHRRISIQSIQEYQYANNLEPTPWHVNNAKLRVLVVEDDASTRQMYQAYFDRWALPLDVVMYASAMQALLDMPTLQPQLLLTDLNMPDMDGFKFLKTLHEHKIFSALPVIVMTGLSASQIESRGGMPREVQVLQKPIDMEWLRGFLDALITVKKVNGKYAV